MNISKYTAWFHDGTLIEILHAKNNIELSLESAELADEDKPEGIILSSHDTIRGKLYLEGVRKITLNDMPFQGVLKKEYDSGGIFDLEIRGNTVEISVKWCNYPPKPRETDFSTIKIEAEKIRWKNVPELVNPSW